MIEVTPAQATPTREPTLGLAVGPNCPVRCEDCYNLFGGGELVTGEEVLEFTADAVKIGIQKVTLSGGDPLFHPDIIQIAEGIQADKQMDTVGVAFLGDTPIRYKGRGIVPRIPVERIAPHFRQINFPADGNTQETVRKFRKGPPYLLEKVLQAADMTRVYTAIGFNCVANQYSIHELPEVVRLAEEHGASQLQIFEHDPTGPNPSKWSNQLRLRPGQFKAATSGLHSDILRLECKSLEDRSEAYFLVNDAGIAWRPGRNGPREIGHIVRDRGLVLSALEVYVSAYRGDAR